MTSWDAGTVHRLRPRTLGQLLDDLDRACDELERAVQELPSPVGLALLWTTEKPSRGADPAKDMRPGSDEGSLNG